jgi:hypothetical protein
MHWILVLFVLAGPMKGFTHAREDAPGVSHHFATKAECVAQAKEDAVELSNEGLGKVGKDFILTCKQEKN